MKTVITILIWAFVYSTDGLFTAQIPDKIIYKGEEYMLHSNPLESYFENHPDKRPKSGIVSSALWRGYVATFEAIDSLFVLKDIEIQVREEGKKSDYKWISVRDEVFPDRQTVHIDWFTGILVLPYGKLKNYVHMGYASLYSNYILLEIENGEIRAERNLNYKEYQRFKDKQFEAFKKSEEYQNLLKKLTKEGHSEEFIESFLKKFIISYTSKFLGD